MKGGETLRLEDGRLLGYAVYGDPEGWPIFYFHGFPGSRLEAQLADRVAARMGIRLIALDRPGFGLSDFKPRRTIFEWPDDVVKIADALGINRFATIGVSGGGPYAAACALKIPQRLTAVAIVCGLGPLDTPNGTDRMIRTNHLIFFLGRRLPWLAKISLWRIAYQVRRNPEGTLRRMIVALPDPDKAVLARPEVKTAMKDNVVEAFRGGSRGAACELLLYTRPWGFLLQDIATRVNLWHGEQDVSVPPTMGQYQARTIPNCRAIFYPGEGHFSLVINHMEEVLSGLLE
ncbi:MAG: alpha/beta hydrolase [Deltaproteobacteria bacterium]|nr:MAG: alpha/beta hydrolase [Deltaproteobacteria bacterium]